MGFSVSHSHSVPRGELPPPAPRDCFGRDELVEKVVGLAENLKPVALIGAGGIGKTSIALTVLHHNRIKTRFGENRRFIRCDQFPASRAHLLAQLSKVTGAGVENPEDMTPLRPFFSSNEMLIILDNAESVLDPQVTNAQEIRSVVEELCQFKTVSLLITSRITTVPRHCKRPEIPTLSMEAACNIFYGIYGDGQRSSIINDLLRRLDFHALSIILLATTASHNTWDYDRLAKEWDAERAQVLQTDCDESLAATIELSLSSPTFRKLDPNARDLLGVIAFFPQGIDEKNLDWLFPTIPNRKKLFDKFCVLSLTHRSNSFVTMLAPIRDYLGPQDPQSSPLLCATRDHYFTQLSVDVDPNRPGFGEARWIVSEDVNVEHLLDVFTSIEKHAVEAWGACYHFMEHLHWHKPRRTVLASKIEALPDDHRYKPVCLFELSELFHHTGNRAEQKRLLTHTLELERRRGNDFQVAQTLRFLSDANRLLGLHEEGIQQTKEASEIYERIDDAIGQIRCLNDLAWLLFDDDQLDAAEDAASRAIDLLPEEGQEVHRCQLHRILAKIYRSKGEKEKAIHHFETAIEIASPFNWHLELYWIYYALTELFIDENEFDDANARIERAKSHAVGNSYKLARVIHLQARVMYEQGRLEDAKSEVLRALEIYEKLGAPDAAVACGELLQEVEQAIRGRTTSS
jgi:tetratricopeptide (TPR) repeat protein